MTNGVREKGAFATSIWSALTTNWRPIAFGFLLGGVLGLVSSTIARVVLKLYGDTAALFNKHFGDLAAWPRHGSETLLIVLTLAAVFYIIRLIIFLKTVLRSWRAGLLSGMGIIWFLTSGVTFVLFNQNGSYLSLLLLGLGVAATLVIGYRDLRIERKTTTNLEADPDQPITAFDQDRVGRGPVVASLRRAIVRDHVPVIALTGAYGDGKTSLLNLLSKTLEENDHDDVLVVPFSSWLPTDQETLVSTFLNSVLEKLQTRLFVPQIKRDLIEFTRLLFAVLPGIPESARGLFEKPSQGDKITELQRSLSRLPVRVVVLLDDMD
jgi:hypothetical protein